MSELSCLIRYIATETDTFRSRSRATLFIFYRAAKAPFRAAKEKSPRLVLEIARVRFRMHRSRACCYLYFRVSQAHVFLSRCGLVHIEPDVFRMLPRLEALDLRDNDLDCLSAEELSHLRMLRTVRIDGNPWLCECRRRMENHFHERSIVPLSECRIRPKICLVQNLQCMTQIDVPLLPPMISIDQTDKHVVSQFSFSRHCREAVV